MLSRSLQAIVLATFVASSSSNAQVLYGSLTGNVVDSSGAAVPSVKVEALNTGTGVSRATATDAAGSYSFNDLQPGTYKVSYNVAAFRSVVHEGINIAANNVLRLDVQLEVAQVTEAITVAGAATVLQTDRSDLNFQIQQSQITNLPFTGN